MKKYYILCGVSLLLCIYTICFMPEIQVVQDNPNEVVIDDENEWTDFFVNGVKSVEEIKKQYTGEIATNKLITQLGNSIGTLNSKYIGINSNQQQIYNDNDIEFYTEFGIESFLEYTILCDALSGVFENNQNAKIRSANVIENTITKKENGLLFEVNVEYTNDISKNVIVLWKNKEEKNIINGQECTNILKILPKMEE